jgi:DDE family transposase
MSCCARGQAENLIKMHKGQLASDRTSCRSPLANQMRLILHAAPSLVIETASRIRLAFAAACPEAALIRHLYPSLRPGCLRSSYAADNPIPIKHRMASERDGWPGSPLRHSSMSCCHSSSSRKLTTGVCPIRGRPRFFRITTFESDMRRVLQQSAHTGNPSLRKPSPCIPRTPGADDRGRVRDAHGQAPMRQVS